MGVTLFGMFSRLYCSILQYICSIWTVSSLSRQRSIVFQKTVTFPISPVGWEGRYRVPRYHLNISLTKHTLDLTTKQGKGQNEQVVNENVIREWQTIPSVRQICCFLHYWGKRSHFFLQYSILFLSAAKG